jgi:hypothetical protein
MVILTLSALVSASCSCDGYNSTFTLVGQIVDGHLDTVIACNSFAPMVTLTLSVQSVANGHVDSVGSSFMVASLCCRSYRGTLSLSINRSMLQSQPVLLSGLLALSVVEAKPL